MILGPSMAGTVPKWVTEPYHKIHEDEEEHGNYPSTSWSSTRLLRRDRNEPRAP